MPNSFTYLAHNLQSTKYKSMSWAPLTIQMEPDLSNVCKNNYNNMNLSNLLYTIWAINHHGEEGDAVKCYLVMM